MSIAASYALRHVVFLPVVRSVEHAPNGLGLTESCNFGVVYRAGFENNGNTPLYYSDTDGQANIKS